MPYANEHACRIRDPSEFVRFRRDNTKDPNVIIGFRKDGSSDVSSYRYPKSRWTAARASAHCREHDGQFEAASDDNEAAQVDALVAVVDIGGYFWSIRPCAFSRLCARIVGQLPAESRSASHDAAIEGDIALIGLYGVLTDRASRWTTTALNGWRHQFGKLASNSDIGAIVIDVDSPGGSVYGVHETADMIYQARRPGRPIIAVANMEMASAAYHIASSADQIVMAPSADVGSIGVIAIHTDYSEADAKAGIRRTLIYRGRHKADGNPFEPLSETAHEHEVQRVGEYYDAFIEDVARGRGVSVSRVEDDYGQGRTFGADKAWRQGMIDRIATLDEVVNRLRSRRQTKRTIAAFGELLDKKRT